MNPKSGFSWHVVYVKSRFERKVHESVSEMAIESYLPMVKTVSRWSDRRKVIEKPLFPSYVFVNIKSSLEFYKVLSVNGACAYIRIGSEYATIREKEINQIKLLIGDKNITDIETNVQLPQVGETKKITYGPLNGLDCEVIKADNHNKIIVRINSLRQNILATVPLYSFENAV